MRMLHFHSRSETAGIPSNLHRLSKMKCAELRNPIIAYVIRKDNRPHRSFACARLPHQEDLSLRHLSFFLAGDALIPGDLRLKQFEHRGTQRQPPHTVIRSTTPVYFCERKMNNMRVV